MNGKIYFLCNSDGKPRYIGLTTKDLNIRLNNHKNDYRHNPHKINWIKKYRNEIEIHLIEENIKSIKELKEKEIFYIKLYRNKNFDLLNYTDGGDYCPYNRIGISPINKGKSKYSDIKDLIKKDILNNISQTEIQKKYNISKGGIYRISLEIKNKNN
jgi:predicted GIY-YIG superfamily endonuclease